MARLSKAFKPKVKLLFTCIVILVLAAASCAKTPQEADNTDALPAAQPAVQPAAPPDSGGDGNNGDSTTEPTADGSGETADGPGENIIIIDVPDNREDGIVFNFAVLDTVYEAEDAQLVSVDVRNNEFTGSFSGGGYVGLFETDDSKAVFTVTVPEDSIYNIFVSNITYMGWGGKLNNIWVNGSFAGEVAAPESDAFVESGLNRVRLNKGENTIEFRKGWGWSLLDYIRVELSGDLFAEAMEFDRTLTNPNADDNAKRLMAYMSDIYGGYVISGQYADKVDSNELNALNAATGKYPAIMGLDMMRYTPRDSWSKTQQFAIEEALKWNGLGGIVSLCWHWYAPVGKWDKFYNNDLVGGYAFDIKEIWREKGELYGQLVAEMDMIGGHLARLRDAGVPVLWRPFHEASGGWFWWGQDRETYLEMWKFMYDRYTDPDGLNLTNLIWVWNGQDKDWFPGGQYCDIVGMDVYSPERQYASHQSVYYQLVEELMAAGTMKIIALTENGVIPDIDNMREDKAMWSHWATWTGGFVIESGGAAVSSQYTEERQVIKMYDSEYVITLDELPDLKTYPFD